MNDSRELVKEFEKRYPWALQYGIKYVKLIDRTTIVIDLTDGNSYVFDASREIYDLAHVRLIDEKDKISISEWRRGFSYWLRKTMENKGIDEDELADRTGLTKIVISRYMNGTARPNDETLTDISMVLDCHEEDLIPHEFIPLP